ncbi:MAG: glycosyltransferase family 2 protein [Verrucomicrobia bacterium]|nr:glycosyltransferase family 2 protein [Verrucomicrobiota bacterium]
MSAVPKVSVLIPTYNYGRYLPEAIESVLRQDFGDFELIVSDDCSTDDTTRILQDYATRDPRIRVHIHKQNLGMVANWNWCLQQARGEYIRYLFGDDCLATPHALGRMVALLDAHPEAALAVSARFTIDEHSTVTGIWDELKTEGIHKSGTIIARCLIESHNLIGEPSVVLFRRAQGLRGFASNLRQIVDLEMWFHLLIQGDALYTPEPLCCFRLHSGQQTAVNRTTKAGYLEMVGILREYLPQLTSRKPPSISPLTVKKILFRALVHLENKEGSQPNLSAEVEWLRNQLPALTRMFCWLDYRLKRPIENLRRSVRKRILRRKMRHAYPTHLAFVKALRNPSQASRTP